MAGERNVGPGFSEAVKILGLFWIAFLAIAIVFSVWGTNSNEQTLFSYSIDGLKFLTGSIVGLVVGKRL